MPIKQGPRGSWRKYSSSNGRYVKMSLEEMLVTTSYRKKKNLTKEERRTKRTAHLKEIAFSSKDPGLYDLFCFIESHIPHYVQYVNEHIYVQSENKSRETDIIGKNAIIEIKMGRKGKRIKQLLAQKEVALKRGMKIILFAPNMLHNSLNEFKKHGIITATTKEELLKEIKK